MENPVKQLRVALGLNQQQFAAVLGCSYGSVQNYENGRAIGPAALERMIALAVERDLLPLAADLKRQYGWPDSPPRAPNPAPAARWHRMLDHVLQHGNAAAIAAVQCTLVLSYDHASVRKPSRGENT